MYDNKSTSGGSIMSKKYEQVQVLQPRIQAMVKAGKAQREIAAQYGIADKYAIKTDHRKSLPDTAVPCRCQKPFLSGHAPDKIY